jgi:hypothetical protein
MRAVGLRAAYAIAPPFRWRGLLRTGDELGEFLEVLSGIRQVEFVADRAIGAYRASTISYGSAAPDRSKTVPVQVCPKVIELNEVIDRS